MRASIAVVSSKVKCNNSCFVAAYCFQVISMGSGAVMHLDSCIY